MKFLLMIVDDEAAHRPEDDAMIKLYGTARSRAARSLWALEIGLTFSV